MNEILNSNLYDISTENEISTILSHFDSDYIFNIIKDNASKKFDYYQMNIPNIVAAFEQHFKQLKLIYYSPEDIENIEYVRNETYREIIKILCDSYNLEFNTDIDIQDLYSSAFYLYDFLISNYKNYVVRFFTNFIIKEKNGLYESLNLSQFRKNKDSSTIYNKKMFKNPKIAIIASNLEYVIKNICVFDIPFNLILHNVYTDKHIIRFLESIVSSRGDFFKENYVSLLNTTARPILLTDIRLSLQDLFTEDINFNINNI